MLYKKSIFYKIMYLFIVMFSLFGFNVVVNAETSIDTTLNIKKTITSAPPKINNTFTYKVTPDTSNPGIITGLTNTFEIIFQDVNCSNGTAVLNKTINFNNLSYNKPGDYRLNIEEISSSDSVSYPLATEKWYIILSIRYNIVNGTPTRELIVKSMAIFDAATDSKDNDGINFTSIADFTSIHIYNDTRGNMADLNKYFKIKVNIEGNTGDVYTVNGQDPIVKYDGKNVETSNTYTVGSTPQYVYLKDDQDVTIGQKIITQGSSLSAKEGESYQEEIKIGTKYSVQEIGSEAYKTYINGSDKPNKNSKEYTLDKNVGIIRIVNIYEADILTGNFIKILPYLLFIAIAVIGLVFLNKKRKITESNFDIK